MNQKKARWILFQYVNGQVKTLSKPFATKQQAEYARQRFSERDRRKIAICPIAPEAH
jgi:hypothetical protein